MPNELTEAALRENELMAENAKLQTALRRIVSLGEKNVAKYAQEIAREALEG